MELDSITIALAGNPNCGKTTLFNSLTGASQSIGNWPGVTVERLEGRYRHTVRAGLSPGRGSRETLVKVIDLPGIYSLSTNSEDESASRNYLLSGEADLVVNVLDATNLERNFYLTLQLREMGLPVLVVLNMMDLATKAKIQIDMEGLSKKLGVPVTSISALRRGDTKLLKQRVQDYVDGKLRIREAEEKLNYPPQIESLIERYSDAVSGLARFLGYSSRWMAIRLMEDDKDILQKVSKEGTLSENELQREFLRLEGEMGSAPATLIAGKKFAVAKSLYANVVERGSSLQTVSNRIDRVVMNRYAGVPIFMVVMYLVFWVTINIGTAFADFFDIFFGTLAVDGTAALLWWANSPEWLITLISGGVGSGVQAIATFVPFIFFMFLILSFLEDSGYMARAAYVTDRFMGTLGLPGKAFVPMLVGFGCTVPAILATKTLDTRRDRLLTIFMVPLMSCGARLPVYALFAATFFGNYSGAVVFSLYVAGILLAVLTGYTVRDSLFAGESSYLIMELPSYHAPRLKHILLRTWRRLKDFMFRAGKTIIIATLILGFLSSFGIDGSFGNENKRSSLLSIVGKTLTPAFYPIGIERDNWPATVGLFTGIMAKEAIIATLSALYGQVSSAQSIEQESVDSETSATKSFNVWGGIVESLLSIPEGLKATISGTKEEEAGDSGLFYLLRQRFTPVAAYSYLLFVLIYCPCIAAISASRREMGILLGVVQVVYLTLLAWALSALFFQLLEGHNLLYILLSLGILVGLIGGFRLIGRR